MGGLPDDISFLGLLAGEVWKKKFTELGNI